MRFIAKYLIVLILHGFSAELYPQTPPEILVQYYNRIEPIKLQLSKVPHGTIQWQESRDQGLEWTDVSEGTSFSVVYSTDVPVFVRAVVRSGTCEPIYSQITSLKTLKILTAGVDSITASSVVIACEMDTGDVSLMEYGILYSKSSIVNETSSAISLPVPASDSFKIKLDQLEEGNTYYARAYGRSTDNKIIYGNILKFSTIAVNINRTLNISTDSAWIKYEVKGVGHEEIDEHGILIDTLPGTLSVANKISGSIHDGQLMTIAGALMPGTDYFIRAFIRLGEQYYYSLEKQIKTWSVYDEPVDTTTISVSYRIEWNSPSTAVKLNPPGTFGEYGRVERQGTSDTLFLVYQGGPQTGDWINIYLRKSFDNGLTWTEQETLMDLSEYPGQYWRFCTPEILSLKNGWILVAFEANARPDENQSSVQILISKDSAKTWEDPIIYITGRSWEPAMVQLPHGEIELFYSCEADWWPNDPIYQDIRVIRSTDNGQTWSEPERVAYYPQKRDGMPVPLVLQGNKGVVFAIETVGSSYSPYIIQREMDEPWSLTTSAFLNSPHRWWISGFSGHGGAPYILQLPTGEVVLTVHIYRGGDWHQNNYQQVLIGDNNVRNFEGLTSPWGQLPMGESAVNNSLFLKDETTIVTISTRMFANGTGGLYWLEGRIVKK